MLTAYVGDCVLIGKLGQCIVLTEIDTETGDFDVMTPDNKIITVSEYEISSNGTSRTRCKPRKPKEPVRLAGRRYAGVRWKKR